ncbi:MAG: MFS transporter [Nanoarchaeota archaeon]
MHHKLGNIPTSQKISSIKKLGFTVFFSGIALSFVTAIWSLYIKSYFNNDAVVGLISSIFIVLSFISFFVIIPIVESSNKYKLFILSSFFVVIGYIAFFFIKDVYLFLLTASLLAIFSTIRVSSFGLLVKSNSFRNNLSKNEGLIYTIANISFVIGPIIVSLLLSFLGIKSIFLISSAILLFSILLFKLSKIDMGSQKKKLDKNLLKNFTDFFKDKNRVKAYTIRAGVTFWWSLIYIYTPLMIIKELDVFWVGIFLGIVNVPLIILEYPFGKIAGKKGYKKLFFIGFLIPSVIALLCFLFSYSLILVLILLVIASIGLAMLEANSESFFFDLMKGKEDQRYYPPYNTSVDLGSITGRLIPSLILLLLPFNYIFLAFGLGMAILAFLSLTTKKIIEEKRKG